MKRILKITASVVSCFGLLYLGLLVYAKLNGRGAPYLDNSYNALITRPLANLGYVEAQYKMGWYSAPILDDLDWRDWDDCRKELRYGELERAIYWFGRAAEQGHVEAWNQWNKFKSFANHGTDDKLSHTGKYPTIADEIAKTLQQYRYQPARVIRNSISKRENYITIDRGTLDGVEPEMAVIADDGIVGYVVRCSDHFSVAVSILNTRDFRTSGRIQGSDFFGSIYWDGLSHREVILDEIPKYADMEVGDTVVTTDYSYIFPPDQPIGTVESFEMVNGTFYKVRVRLFTDLARLCRVYAVHYLEQEERRALENTIENANNDEKPETNH